MKIKSIPIESLNLDLKRISQKDLEDIATFIEQIIADELNKTLGARILNFIVTISTEVSGDAINVAIDLEVDSYLIPNISLESILDKVINNAFARLRAFLSTRYRKTGDNAEEQQIHSHHSTC